MVCNPNSTIEYMSIFIANVHPTMKWRPSLKYCRSKNDGDCYLYSHQSGSTTDVTSRFWGYVAYYNFNGPESQAPENEHVFTFVDPLAYSVGGALDESEACIISPGMFFDLYLLS